MIYLVDEATIYFIIIVTGLAVALPFILVIWKMGPQARKLGKATIRKKPTAIVANEAGQLDIEVGKTTTSGHFEVGKNRAYEIIHAHNPSLDRKFHWKGMGTPVFLGDVRKAAVVSPSVVTAIESAEAIEEKLPKEYKQFAGDIAQSIQSTNPKKKKKGVVQKILSLDPLKLKKYLSEHIDMDAQDVLMDKRFQAGWNARGKQYMLLGAVFGLVAVMGLFVILVAFAGG